MYIGQCTHLTIAKIFSNVKCVHWPMYTLDSNKIDFTVCSDITLLKYINSYFFKTTVFLNSTSR